MKKVVGFTLIEILVALVLLGVVAGVAVMSLGQGVKVEQGLVRGNISLQSLQMAYMQLVKDFAYRSKQPNLKLDVFNARELRFSRTTKAKKNRLTVHFWWDHNLTRDFDKPRVLLQDIHTPYWQYLDEQGSPHASWPLCPKQQSPNSTCHQNYPRGVVAHFIHPQLGEINWVFSLS